MLTAHCAGARRRRQDQNPRLRAPPPGPVLGFRLPPPPGVVPARAVVAPLSASIEKLTAIFDLPQRQLFDHLRRIVDAQASGKPLEQELQLLIAGPGAGKTTVMKAIDAYGKERGVTAVIMAAMASAANHFEGGLTVHSAIGENMHYSEARLDDAQKIDALKRNHHLDQCWIVIFDEIPYQFH